jgi:hypothetical protein
MLLVGCEKQESVEIYMEDGVEVIVNHLEPYKIKGEPSQLNLEEEIVIDFERDDLAELGIKEFRGFDVDSEGNIYFVFPYRKENQIFKFNKYGKFKTSFGRGGQGPGELQEPQSLRINELDQVIAPDYAKKICLFEKNGDLVSETPLASGYIATTLLENGKILIRKRIFKLEEGRTELPIILCGADFEEIKTLHAGKRMPILSRAKKIHALNIYFDYIWKISKGLIFVGNYGSEYEFLVFDMEGNLMRKIRKEYIQVPVPDILKKEILNRFENHPMNEELKLKGKVSIPKYFRPFQFFFVDDECRLYVMSYERGEGPNDFIYDIFAPDGVFVGRIPLDNCGYWPQSTIKIPLEAKAKNNRIYRFREKENGYRELVVYKMIWSK